MATLLTFESLAKEPDNIIINGVPYDILDPSKFGLLGKRALYQTSKRIQNLLESENEVGITRARIELDKFLKKVMPDLTDEALSWLSTDEKGKTDEGLGENRKLAIMEAFMKAVEAHDQATQPPSKSDQKAG